ncbi:MAG: carboxypeptidase-like regulatory domain-containing protein [Flammeovirgaceae bacterium]
MKTHLLCLLLVLSTYTAIAQITVTGTIKDDRYDPLPGAMVTIKGTTEGTVADIDGKYSIKVADEEAVLVFSYVGYEDQEVTVGTQTVIDVILRSGAVLEEVVISNSRARRSNDSRSNSSSITETAKKESRNVKGKSTTWKRSNKTTNLGALFVGDKERIPLKGAQIAIKVDGFRARVLIDCFFYSNQDRQLEGTFKMKLPQGASPYYFAFGESVYLDNKNSKSSIPFLAQNEVSFSTDDLENIRQASWSSLKVAHVVPKEKAALAYEETVRGQIDPALVEWAGADVYNCRVFPIQPKTLHRIVIGYDVNLTTIQDDWVLDFSIPKVTCPLIVDVDMAAIPNISSSITPKKNAMARNGRNYYRFNDPKFDQLQLRYQSLKNAALTTNTSAPTDRYTALAITPNLPHTPNTEVANTALIALDISLSANPDQFNVWLKMAKALLNNNPAHIKKFNVLLFNIEAFWWQAQPVENTPKNVRKFLSFANNLSLEGASDINLALSTIATTNWTKNQDNSIFFLTDGDDTWGESDVYAMIQQVKKGDRIFGFNTGMSGININKLTQLTRATGGALFSITGESEVQKASKAFRAQPWKIDKITMDGIADILITGRPEYLYAGQKLFLSGRGNLKSDATLYLEVSQNGKTKKLAIPIKHTVQSELAQRVYGQMATIILEELEHLSTKESIAFARYFRVPGQTCSLLMLESNSDYDEYEIKLEADSSFIQETTINAFLEKTLSSALISLSNPKLKFEHWLTKLSQLDGLTFNPSDELEALKSLIPVAKFSIPATTLRSKSIRKSSLDEQFGRSLLSDPLDYDTLYQEAHRRLGRYGADDALKAISSLVENSPSDAVLTRDVAYAAMEWGLNEQAYYLFKRLSKSRPYEPQNYLAMAKALAHADHIELACLYYEIAITTEWNRRFGEFTKIATLEYLNVLRKLINENHSTLTAYAQARYATIKSNFNFNTVDMMIVVSWNTDNTDIDLHVVEPTGEECYYSHSYTKIGGRISRDVTQGYGPEMYILPTAVEGKYKIKVNYYSADRNRTSTRTKVYVSVYRNWGTEKETIEHKTIVLNENKEMQDIMKLTF